jgi:two-component system chemotaxis response regulator CheY
MALNILIVDDSATMRSMVQKTIQMAGVPVTRFLHAANGREGLDCLDKEWVDVIFVDINMPVMGGLEMIDQIRANPNYRNLAIIVISTESSQTRIQEVHSKGVHFIHKPFTPERLKEVISELIGNLAFKVQASKSQLEKITQNVLETMAFSVMMPTCDEYKNQDTVKSAKIDFIGPFSGMILFTVSNDVLNEMARNMLGIDDENQLGEQQMNDALGELANVICGNLLSELAGLDPVFDLKAPIILPSDEKPAILDVPGDITTAGFAFDNGWAELTLIIQDTISSETKEAIIEVQ